MGVSILNSYYFFYIYILNVKNGVTEFPVNSPFWLRPIFGKVAKFLGLIQNVLNPTARYFCWHRLRLPRSFFFYYLFFHMWWVLDFWNFFSRDSKKKILRYFESEWVKFKIFHFQEWKLLEAILFKIQINFFIKLHSCFWN